jgi:cyclin E
LLLLKLLKWDLSPMTTNSWLNVFLQLAENMDSDDFVIPQYSAHNFVQLARVSETCDRVGEEKLCFASSSSS